LDRSIKVELDRIRDEDNIPDTKIEEELQQQIPELLGYIFDVISKALEIRDTVNNLMKLPRMADFALWGEAIARALGYQPLKFMDIYFENIGEQNFEIVENNPFADAISKFADFDKQSWISSPTIFINSLREFADNNNNIDSSKFPRGPQSISRQLNKIKSNLREGLGIEVIVDRNASVKGNKKQRNTAIIKIRKVSPLSPLSPSNQNDEGNEVENGGDINFDNPNTSVKNKIPPSSNSSIYAQITSDIDKSGGNGVNGGILQTKYTCHYCDYTGNRKSELIRHSINSHPGKVAQPDESITKLEKGSEEEV
jgi:hypothetical protein